MLRLLSSDASICAIGDPDQALWFRGSDVKFFCAFKKIFPALL